MRVIYRMLLVTVIIYPLWVFSHGPIKINHRDGEYEAFQLVSRKEVAKDHYELVLKRKVFLPQKWIVDCSCQLIIHGVFMKRKFLNQRHWREEHQFYRYGLKILRCR